MNYTCVDNERGSAAILAILVSGVMITAGIGFNWIVKEHLKAAEEIKAKAEAMVAARSACDTLTYSILSGTMAQREIVFPSGERLLGVNSIRLGGAAVQLENGVSIKVRDSSGLISVISMKTDVLKRLTKLLGAGDETVNSVTDSYIDWIDSDDFSRLNGAESAYYRGEDVPYVTRNFTMQYKDEMAFIKGMSPDLYKKMERYLTILPSLGFNPNTADDEVLMAYLDIDKEALENLKNYMEKKPVSSDTELFALTGKRLMQDEEGVYYFPSPYLEITIEAGRPRIIYTLSLGVDVRQTLTSPFNVVYWKEG